jgi:GntR family transcriptional regulator
VKRALRLGLLSPGDQLPTAREVVASLAINPNTVLKAYRELEMEGLVASRPGLGTFVLKSLAGPSLASHAQLQADLRRWLGAARAAGLDEESIAALFTQTIGDQQRGQVA